MKRILLLLLALAPFLISLAQEEEEQKFGITFKGFVKNDFILDSRQTVSVRDGHFLLYPANVNPDMEGNDINARSSFNYLAIQSRLSGHITGPDAFGAKTSGLIEGAFFGQLEDNINSFRLRHAFLKLSWPKTEVILGQYWHHFFVTDCYPGTISFNTGVPFQFFSRNPQIRITQTFGSIKMSGVAATQLDFASPGGPDVLRNSLLPDLSGQISYSQDKSFLAGVSAGYKQLLPRLVTSTNYITKNTIGGFTFQAFLKYATQPLTIKFEGLYGQNTFDGLMVSGFAVKSITDPVRDFRDYTTINTAAFWADIHTNGEKIQGGIFLGYTQNLGSNDLIDANVMDQLGNYSRGSDIAYVYRISPRLIINSGKVRFAVEAEHTGAGYGDSVDSNAVPQNPDLVINNRLLVAAFYFF